MGVLKKIRNMFSRCWEAFKKIEKHKKHIFLNAFVSFYKNPITDGIQKLWKMWFFCFQTLKIVYVGREYRIDEFVKPCFRPNSSILAVNGWVKDVDISEPLFRRNLGGDPFFIAKCSISELRRS